MIVMNLQMPSEDRFCKRLSCFKKWEDMNLNKLLQWWSTCNCLTNKISSQIGFFVGLLSKNIDRKLVTVVLDHVIVVQLLCHVWLFVIPWTAVGQTSLSLTISWSLLKLTSITSVMPSNHLVLCRPLLLLPTIPPSIRVFSNESVLRVRWPKYWSFSFSISPSNEYSGLISFRIDCFDLLVVQRTLKSLLQHRSSKASVHWCSTVFMVQLSHPYMTAGKTIGLTIQAFVGKVMSLLFNVLSRFVIAFLPRSKCLLISWLHSLSTVILQSKKIKSLTVSIVSTSICHEVMGPDAMILVFECWVFSQFFPLSPSSRGTLVSLCFLR